MKKSNDRTEVKTRLVDEVYDRASVVQADQRIASDSAALARVVELGLFGFVPGALVLREKKD